MLGRIGLRKFPVAHGRSETSVLYPFRTGFGGETRRGEAVAYLACGIASYRASRVNRAETDGLLRCDRLLLALLLQIFGLLQLFHEPVDAAFRVYQFLPAGEKRVAARADFHAEVAL